jgi:hypothetical protein
MTQDRLTWIGRTLTALFALFLAGASIAPKLLHLPAATDTLTALGWDPRHTLLIGLIELSGLILYLVPRTSVLGAILLTGLLGGAMATQLRADSPLFSHVLFGLYLGLVLWGAFGCATPGCAPWSPCGARPVPSAPTDAVLTSGATILPILSQGEPS